jgi:2,3-dihydroxybenzoate decarboxylase
MAFTPVYTAPPKKVRIIALEEHFTTPALAMYAKAMTLAIAPEPMEYMKKRLLDLESLRIEEMDRYGIDVQVMNVTTPGVQDEPDRNVAVRKAQEVNDLLAKVIQRHPKRLKGFAHLALQDPLAAANELERSVRELGFKGALINGATNGEYLDAEKFFPVWERAESLGVPIYLHPANAPEEPACLKGYPELSGAMWGWTPETAGHVLRIIFGGVFDRFPKSSLILGHMGETLPYLLWRFDSRYVIMHHNKPLKKVPSQYIRENILVTTSGSFSYPPLLCAMLAISSDRIMFSVDYPYEETKEAVEFIYSAPLSEIDREKICHLNAERVLNLEAGHTTATNLTATAVAGGICTRQS